MFLNDDGLEFSEASVTGIHGNRVTYKDGSTVDEVEIESITLVNLQLNVDDRADRGGAENEFADDLIFGAIDPFGKVLQICCFPFVFSLLYSRFIDEKRRISGAEFGKDKILMIRNER